MRKLNAYELNLLFRNGFDVEFVAKFPEDYPIEYIVQNSEFRGINFFLNKNVLIPRIETEEVIEIATKHTKFSKKILFVDIGTGSGCIGISFAKILEENQKDFTGYLSDVSKKALKVAKINAEIILQKNRKIKILHSDLFKNYPSKIRFDLIFANLPYVPKYRKLADSLKYEPKKALLGGGDGLEFIRKLVKQLPQRLKKSGIAIFEIDHTHDKFFLNQNKFIVQIIKDSFQKNRFAILKLK